MGNIATTIMGNIGTTIMGNIGTTMMGNIGTIIMVCLMLSNVSLSLDRFPLNPKA